MNCYNVSAHKHCNRRRFKPWHIKARYFHNYSNYIPRHEFETLTNRHHCGRSFRTASRWPQFVTMTMAQLADRNSLRDIVENISAQAYRLYHLGSAKFSRSDLSRVDEDKPYALYEALPGKLLGRCQGMMHGHDSHFKIRCIHWMPRPLTSACRFSHGPIS
jgi:hypothetical protein